MTKKSLWDAKTTFWRSIRHYKHTEEARRTACCLLYIKWLHRLSSFASFFFFLSLSIYQFTHRKPDPLSCTTLPSWPANLVCPNSIPDWECSSANSLTLRRIDVGNGAEVGFRKFLAYEQNWRRIRLRWWYTRSCKEKEIIMYIPPQHTYSSVPTRQALTLHAYINIKEKRTSFFLL